MRQCAWLDAVPDAPEEMKRLSDTKEKYVERVTRRMALINDGQAIPLPQIDVEYLVDILFEVGPTMASGMGELPLSHSELLAWMSNSGIELHPWESSMLRRLSRDYLASSVNAVRRDCPAPWAPRGDDINKDVVAKKIRAIFR